MNTEQNKNEEKDKGLDFGEFLKDIPTNETVKVEPFQCDAYGNNYSFHLPSIELYCDNEACNGYRFFQSDDLRLYIVKGKVEFHFIKYRCKNCQQTLKIFAIGVNLSKDLQHAYAFKFGEFPFFGPSIPPKLIKLIDPDKDFFLMGIRCENQGLGIGAFVYYRRVVENQKNRIFYKIIQAVQKISPKDVVIKELEKAKKKTQFSKAVKLIKHTLPESLRINGYNPLALLNKALSEDIQDQSDQYCLELAGSIRVILTELAEKIAQALKDEAELKNAISKVIKRKI